MNRLAFMVALLVIHGCGQQQESKARVDAPATQSPAQMQDVRRLWRVGYLGDAHNAEFTGDFLRGLRDAGYVEGETVAIEYRYAEGKVERLPALAAELVGLPVDVIVTAGEPAALAAKRATQTVPIVATEFGLDPVKAGLVTSLGRPEGNVTGLTGISEELWQKRLALLKQVAPKVSRMAVLWNPASPGNARCVDELMTGTPGLGIQLRTIEVRDAKMVRDAFAHMTKLPTDAVAICWDSLTLAQARPIAEFALARKLPTLAPLKEYAQAGALLSFGASLSAQRRRIAYYVNRILKGAKPSDLPVERPTLFELVVNMHTAKALGLTVPPGIALLADELLQE